MKMREWFLPDKPARWIQKYMIKQTRGKIVSTCLLGAIKLCYNNDINFIYPKIQKYLNIESVTGWNDNQYRTYKDVVKLVNDLDI